jgi:hypothetical protein
LVFSTDRNVYWSLRKQRRIYCILSGSRLCWWRYEIGLWNPLLFTYSVCTFILRKKIAFYMAGEHT